MGSGEKPRGGPATDWREVHRDLTQPARHPLSAAEHDLLADALFWLDRREDSIVARRDAYRAHLSAANPEGAALAAWRLFYEHFLVGEQAQASGWLERCRRQAAHDAPSAGWLAVADADVAMSRGEAELGLTHAVRARDAGRGTGGGPDLDAMALQAEGRAHIALGHRQQGLGLLDEAMIAVINGEVGPLFTGWVFCNVVSTCYGLADLRRATEWSDAAMRWCATLRDGLMYTGLCRVYSVELACLRGAWSSARAQADRACIELTSHDPRYAGTAYYLVGELRRLTGDLAAAQVAYSHAHQLGCTPQPGLALVRLAEGRAGEAVRALQSCLAPGPSSPLPRALILTALVESALADGDCETAHRAVEELASLAETSASQLVTGYAVSGRAQTQLAQQAWLAALPELRAALAIFLDLGLPYEVARQRARLGQAARHLADLEGARLELDAALTAFEALGAEPDAARVRALLRADPAPTHTGGAGTDGYPLTGREREVLALVAAGGTNREIAHRLVLSPHTVARHVANIMTKLGVSSRAAATAVAYREGLIGPWDGPD